MKWGQSAHLWCIAAKSVGQAWGGAPLPLLNA
ncbi:Uncharacterised protein [Bordetella pertussis]|nr:Uncharacterised protein [Bordetella pertussis]